MTERRMRTGLAAGAVGLLLAAGCTPGTSGDRPSPQTVTEVADQADLVVSGTPTAVVGAERDDGGADEPVDEAVGPTVVFWSVTVDSVIVGGPAASVVVALPGGEASDGTPPDSITPVVPGEPLLLFLVRRDPATAPGVTSVDEYYVPVGGDVGVFDVDDDEVTPRSPTITGLTDPDEATGGFSTTLEEVRSTVEPD